MKESLVREVMDDLTFVMKKHGCVLGVDPRRPGCFLLAEIKPGRSAHVIASIKQINPEGSETAIERASPIILPN